MANFDDFFVVQTPKQPLAVTPSNVIQLKPGVKHSLGNLGFTGYLRDVVTAMHPRQDISAIESVARYVFNGAIGISDDHDVTEIGTSLARVNVFITYKMAQARAKFFKTGVVDPEWSSWAKFISNSWARPNEDYGPGPWHLFQVGNKTCDINDLFDLTMDASTQDWDIQDKALVSTRAGDVVCDAIEQAIRKGFITDLNRLKYFASLVVSRGRLEYVFEWHNGVLEETASASAPFGTMSAAYLAMLAFEDRGSCPNLALATPINPTPHLTLNISGTANGNSGSYAVTPQQLDLLPSPPPEFVKVDFEIAPPTAARNDDPEPDTDPELVRPSGLTTVASCYICGTKIQVPLENMSDTKLCEKCYKTELQ